MAVEAARIATLVLVLIAAGLQVVQCRPTNSSETYTIVKRLPSGIVERIVRWHDVCAKEVVSDDDGAATMVRQVWLDDSTFELNMVFAGDNLTQRWIDETEISDFIVCEEELQRVNEHQFELTLQLHANDSADIDEQFPWLARSVEHLRQQTSKSMEQSSSRRARRGIQELIIAPGTKWCGPHRLAYSYKDLGALDGLDRCCRRHDHCPRAISPFSERYGLFNYMPFTLSHCGCDERFRTCLKMTSTSSANLIGKIFFNMVQTKCFVLKPAKICKKRSWWGKCEKHVYKKQGYLRDNVSY
ncbi:uncharacterized protein LOC131664436 [Phymastichus coffea]|uniref:uncharacterized protein LOC131664436 n=1 Tax=Phymastichus coffea TaxID=108790 RepID=UPI00273AA032|nr:uncharacterized protein LOC131664436 [Phymastichus coffea]